MPVGNGTIGDCCHSPKFGPAVKSTACTLSSTRRSAMTVLHVPLLPAAVRTTGSLLSFASHTALGELGAPAATHRTETQAPQTKGRPPEQLFWVLAHRFWSAWKSSLIIVTPETVARWHRAGFRRYWSLISRVKERVGRKKLSQEIRDLIFQMATDRAAPQRRRFAKGIYLPTKPRHNHRNGTCLSGDVQIRAIGQLLGEAAVWYIAFCSPPFFAQSDPAGQIMSNTHPEHDLAHFG